MNGLCNTFNDLTQFTYEGTVAKQSVKTKNLDDILRDQTKMGLKNAAFIKS